MEAATERGTRKRQLRVLKRRGWELIIRLDLESTMMRLGVGTDGEVSMADRK